MRAWIVVLASLAGGSAHATANYVYFEETANPTGGACGNFLDTPAPAAAQPYTLRFRIEYQFFTNQARVYYTTDGSSPVGALGVGAGSTAVATAAYTCTYDNGFGQIVDVATATLPGQPAGTHVSYVVSAWHDQGGPEVFADSGNCNASGCATVFGYTVVDPPDLTMPDLTMPDLLLPDLQMPDLQMPDLQMPDLRLPDLQLPDLQMPDLQMQTPDLAMSTPDLSAPTDQLPPADDSAAPLDLRLPADLSRADRPAADGGGADLRLVTPSGGGGCSCALGGHHSEASPLAALALLALLLLRRKPR